MVFVGVLIDLSAYIVDGVCILVSACGLGIFVFVSVVFGINLVSSSLWEVPLVVMVCWERSVLDELFVGSRCGLLVFALV